MTGGTHHTCYRRLGTFLKAKASDDDMSVAAVLTMPREDLVGDIVHPDGLNFGPHMRNPAVDLEHGRDPAVKRQPVGWARKSLSKPGSPYALEWSLLPLPQEGDERSIEANLPIGTTYFDRDDPLQRQVYFLVRNDALPGVSLEFLPIEGQFKSRGKAANFEKRDAYEFYRADVLRWTLCAEPICPGALTVTKGMRPELAPLVKVLRDRRVEGEKLHPVILKSLSHYQPTTKLIALPPVEKKAVEPDAPNAIDTPETVYDPDMPDEGDAADGPPVKPTAQAHYSVAQGILDLIDQAESDLEASEHVKGKKFLLKKLEALRADAEAIKGMGDKIDSETSGNGDVDDDADAEGEPDSDSESDAGDDEDDDPDMDTDDDGVLKAVRPGYRPVLKARRVKRYSLEEINKGIEAAKAAAAAKAEDDPEEVAKALAELAREQKRFRRTQAMLS